MVCKNIIGIYLVARIADIVIVMLEETDNHNITELNRKGKKKSKFVYHNVIIILLRYTITQWH